MTEVVGLIESAFSEHWIRLVKQERWTDAQVANDLKSSESSSDVGVYGAIATCSATLSNQMSAINMTSSDVAPSAISADYNVTLESGVSKDSNSGVDSHNVERSSSWYIFWLFLALINFLN